MKFEVYNYQCSPDEWDGGFFTEEAKQYREEALAAMDLHLEIIDELLTNEKIYYPQGTGMTQPFKDGDTFSLLRLSSRKRPSAKPEVQTELNKPFLTAKMLYAHTGFYLMSVQNHTMLHREMNWVKDDLLNMPSCIVIIANTEGRQLLLVEDNTAFSSTRVVARIFQDSLEALLRDRKLNIRFRPHYSPDKFWEHLEKKLVYGVGLKYLKCHFDYPNMAQDAKLLGSFFEEFGVEMNAEMDYSIKGQHGQPLTCDPKNRNSHLQSIIEYGGKTGNKIQAGYMDKSKQTYDADHVGISTLVADENIRKTISQMVKEMLTESRSGMLPLDDDNGDFRNKLAVWLRALNDAEA